MAVILSIDTSSPVAAVGVYEGMHLLADRTSEDQKEHASFIQVAIQNLFRETEISLKNIDAVAVTSGPGSYTGLRVGLATAKGLCYALDKPLILINTLHAIAMTQILHYGSQAKEYIYLPMIDARRTDVFVMAVDDQLHTILPMQAVNLMEYTFEPILPNQKIVVSGNGAMKAQEYLSQYRNASFSAEGLTLDTLNMLAQQKFDRKAFADVAYAVPDYAKEFYTTAKIITNHTQLN